MNVKGLRMYESECKFFASSGDNVVIEDSYIWDGVKIENNCRISKSLLCDNVQVKQYVIYDNFSVFYCPEVMKQLTYTALNTIFILEMSPLKMVAFYHSM